MTELTCIRFGDSIGLVNGSFALATPSLHEEPISDRMVPLSGMRAVGDGDHSSTAAGFQFPSDYADRCIFKIVQDRNSVSDSRSSDDVCFGSAVRLIHEPTGHALTASSVDHCLPGALSTGKKVKCVYLRKEMTREEDAASHWIIQSRYKLRREGDSVRVNDSVILKSIYYKDFFLTIPDSLTVDMLSKDNQHKALCGPHYVGMTTCATKVSASGWIVKCFRTAETKLPESVQNNENEADVKPRTIRTGSYVRIAHIESKGHIVCRADDAKAVLSKVAPLGSIYRIQSGVRSETHGVYMRCPAANGSTSEATVANTNDCLNVWQILPRETGGLEVFKEVSSAFNSSQFLITFVDSPRFVNHQKTYILNILGEEWSIREDTASYQRSVPVHQTDLH